jgi:hypothetical protein
MRPSRHLEHFATLEGVRDGSTDPEKAPECLPYGPSGAKPSLSRQAYLTPSDSVNEIVETSLDPPPGEPYSPKFPCSPLTPFSGYPPVRKASYARPTQSEFTSGLLIMMKMSALRFIKDTANLGG